MTGNDAQVRALTIGAHVLDTLVRPVEALPPGQGATLVEQIAISPAGTAAAAAMVLSKLGAQVRTAGVIGDDPSGTMLAMLLQSDGVDTTLLHRMPGMPTSASVLPIRPDGGRPAFHVIGTNQYLAQHIPWEAIDDADIVYLGGVEFYGGELAAQILRRAREGGAVTAADSLSPGFPGTLDYIQAALPEIDYLLPNDEQVIGWTGAPTLHEGCRKLVERGARCVVATAGPNPTVIATADGTIEVSAYPVDVVDTSGCGDSFSAGFLRGISLGQEPRQAARLGHATAAQVAQGLGSNFGSFTLDTVQQFIIDREQEMSK
ncbi:carbohydrate kinase family protein [Nocardia anaemiae]|uniref:carbohydrate kinase family protein n=1 Tax=Nocardia anaemiae TaxID=263910 RepID=UPI0007A50E00|nr:PfkB family carbohydrate kinase [Nocardia anaemiae]